MPPPRQRRRASRCDATPGASTEEQRHTRQAAASAAPLTMAGAADIDYRQLLESVHAIVWRADAQTFQTTFASQEAEEILGYPLESWLKVPGFWFDHVHPEDKEWVARFSSSAIREHRRHDFEYRMITADQQVVWLRNIVNVVVENGTPVELVGVTVDISTRKRAEFELANVRHQLGRVARAAALGELVATLAHELNQPLGAIISNAESAQLLVKQAHAERHRVFPVLEEIHQDAARAASIIRSVVGMLKQQHVEARPVDLVRLIEASLDIVRPLLASHGIEPVAQMSPDVPVVTGDAVQIQQVLLNLILNAIEAMTPSEPGRRRLIIRACRAGGDVEVAVEDTGTGIPPHLLPHVFEPFWTTKSGGIGIGLAICRRIVEACGGTIAAGNNPGGGATLCFTLPTTEEEGA